MGERDQALRTQHHARLLAVRPYAPGRSANPCCLGGYRGTSLIRSERGGGTGGRKRERERHQALRPRLHTRLHAVCSAGTRLAYPGCVRAIRRGGGSLIRNTNSRITPPPL